MNEKTPRERFDETADLIDANIEGSTIYDAYGLIGVLTGVRPGVLLSVNLTDQHELGMKISEEWGYRIVVYPNGLIVNLDVLEKRMHENQEFLKEFDLEVNDPYKLIDSYGSKLIDSLQQNVATGFILGFPLSAIRDYERMISLVQKGIPSWDYLLIGTEEKSIFEKYGMGRLPDDVIKKLEDINSRKKSAVESRVEFSVHNFREFFVDLLIKYYNVKKSDAEHLLNMKTINIGRVIQFASTHETDPEIVELRNKVKAATDPIINPVYKSAGNNDDVPDLY